MTERNISHPRLIAITSPVPESGKSEIAKHLVEVHGFTRLKFAEPLKNMIRSLLRDAGVPETMIERYVEGDLKKTVIPEIGVSFRHLAKTLGTEWGRDLVRSDLWVSITRRTATALIGVGQSVVLDDMRFGNEWDMVPEFQGERWRVRRPAAVLTDTHRSEGELDGLPADVEIENDTTIAMLTASVDQRIN